MICNNLNDFLQNPDQYTELDLICKNLNSKNAIEIANILKTNNSVHMVALNGNRKIGYEGASALAEALKHNKSVTKLHLNSCNVGSVDIFAKTLEFNRSLTGIDLGHNDINSFSCVGELAKAIEGNHSITWINLKENQIHNDFIAEITETLGRNKNIFSETSELLEILVALQNDDDTLMLEEVLSDYPALLREFYNHPDAFKASFQYDVGNKALNNIKNFVLENMLPIHAVAKDIAQDTSAFKEAPTEVLNNIAIFLAPGDIDLFSIDAPLAGDSNHESKEDYDYEFKEAS